MLLYRVIFIFILTVILCCHCILHRSIIMNFPPNKKGQQSDRWCCVNGKPLKKSCALLLRLCFYEEKRYAKYKQHLLFWHCVWKDSLTREKVYSMNVTLLSFRILCNIFVRREKSSIGFFTECIPRLID